MCMHLLSTDLFSLHGLHGVNVDFKSAYENLVFCETFHLEESGWRECRICGKQIHCGCIASRYVHEYMDFGGVGCITCIKRLEILPEQSLQIPSNVSNGTVPTNGIKDVHPVIVDNRIDDKFSSRRLLQLTKVIGAIDGCSGVGQLTHDDPLLKNRQSSKFIPNLTQQNSQSTFFKTDNSKPREGVQNIYEPASQPSLNFSLTTPSSSSAFPAGIAEGSEQCKGSLREALNILLKPPKPSPTVGSEMNKGTVHEHVLLGLLLKGKVVISCFLGIGQGSPTMNCSNYLEILSASDAGRIGRLVLPKACAEAFSPLINQSEGIPILIQDMTGKEWTFQFRFWPNNNSRMYVLEGVTPCILNMQVQAGDTEPGGKFVIGCRKAINNGDTQDSQTLASTSGDSPGGTSFSGTNGNLLSNGGKTSGDSLQQSISEKKTAKNIKNKRLLMHTDDATELRITWEEAQEFLRPFPTAEPTIVVVEDHEFEEFEGQLAQCDSCLKWRKLPVHALLSAKWTCSENIWDLKRFLSSCPAPEEIRPIDLEPFVPSCKDYSRLEQESKWPQCCLTFSSMATDVIENLNMRQSECFYLLSWSRPSGLYALATAAVLGHNISDIAECSLDREAEVAQAKDRASVKIEPAREDISGDTKANTVGMEADMEEASKGQLDLNCDPHREDKMLAQTAGMSLTTLMNAVTVPLDMYLEPTGAQKQENITFVYADTEGTQQQ
ncbi:hypothetical protein SASPL_122959 [Salvia splendens]|uniref:CW-type domain-containing protein n=1 Tax=Salvia splendens TaxID=180675 RepID=A0A8X8XQA2_SALSN|nr:hypothetical protein SASPL_122959 [Salvia splendens]